MLNYNDLKEGQMFVYEGSPYEVISFAFLRMQQRKPVAQTEIKNLITGKILQRNFHMNETFEEVEIDRIPVKYLYNTKGAYWFSDLKDPSKRFSLTEEVVGNPAHFTKPNTQVDAIKWVDRIITVNFPIKAELKVVETPPGEKGNSASNTTKTAKLETGVEIQVPMFVGNGDIVRVNTLEGTYVERVEKAAGGL
jgi:elongation factor P